VVIGVLVVDQQIEAGNKQDAEPHDNADDQKYIHHCRISCGARILPESKTKRSVSAICNAVGKGSHWKGTRQTEAADAVDGVVLFLSEQF